MFGGAWFLAFINSALCGIADLVAGGFQTAYEQLRQSGADVVRGVLYIDQRNHGHRENHQRAHIPSL
jgi:hypothetical protein